MNDRITVAKALNRSLHEMMAQDDRVVVIGEDILDPYGGAFKVTSGLSSKFPQRCYTTPISEAGIVGVGIGLAMRGFLPIVEIMFGDFVTLAADQLINHAAKFSWMYNEQVSVPLVVRTPMGGRRGYGATHSQTLEKHFLGVPGLWVVACNEVLDPGRLLRMATLECDKPVLFIENKALYTSAIDSAGSGMDIIDIRDDATQFPTIMMRHNKQSQSADGIIFTYGGMVSLCREVVRELNDQEGLVLDMVVLSQLSPTPLIHLLEALRTVTATKLFYVEEASVMGGWSAEIMSAIVEHASGIGNVTHRRIGAKHLPVPSSMVLEKDTLPQISDIVRSIMECF